MAGDAVAAALQLSAGQDLCGQAAAQAARRGQLPAAEPRGRGQIPWW